MPTTGQPTFSARSMTLHHLLPDHLAQRPAEHREILRETHTLRPSIVPWPVTTASPYGRFPCMSKS